MRPEAILFDLGGTLLHQDRYAPFDWVNRLPELTGDSGIRLEGFREAARQLHREAVALRKTSLTEIPMWSLLRNLHD